MTQVFWVFPEVHVKPAPKKQRNGPAHKYDHWQMVQDRLAGMSWFEIGIKHGMKGKDRRAVSHSAWKVLYTTAVKRLQPSEIARLEAIDGRKVRESA